MVLLIWQLAKSNKKDKPGRPRKPQRTVPARTLSGNNDGWVTEDTCFGVFRRGVNGDVLMPAEMYDDIDMQFNSLSESMYIVVLYITCTKCKYFTNKTRAGPELLT